MAFLTETTTYEGGIYQIETTDPVLGGPSGVTNTPLRQLANRTNWLKAQTDKLGFGSSGTSPLGGNLNTALEGGWYYVQLGATNKPPEATEGFLNVVKYTTAGYTLQVYHEMTADRMWSRRITDGPTFEAWSEIARASALDSLNAQLVGVVAPFGTSSAPSGWLKCNGAAVSRTTYADLFARIGTTFGAGNGSTTFNLPDLRGEFIRGLDDGRGVDTSRALGSAQLDQLQGHYHTLAYQNTGATPGALTTGLSTFSTTNILANEARAIITDGTNGTPRVGAETRPRNVALLYCIKF